VYFVDVGQGDCEYIKTPDNKKIIIDGGDKGKGNKIVKPFLNDLGVFLIDLCMVTHFHDDHANGISEIMDNIDINHLIIPTCKNEFSLHDNLVNKAKIKKINLEYVSANDKVAIDKNIDFNILYAGENYSKNNENNNSIVSKISYGNTSFLFTGDIEKNIEHALLKRRDLMSTVLKAAHHGSNSSSALEILKKIMPEYVIIEVGQNNKYGHPGEKSLNRFNEINAKVYRTDKNGTIKFIADKNGIKKVNVLRE
jgi:competence protein ComEC